MQLTNATGFFYNRQIFPTIWSPTFFIIPSTLSTVPVSATLPAFARRKEVDGATNLK